MYDYIKTQLEAEAITEEVANTLQSEAEKMITPLREESATHRTKASELEAKVNELNPFQEQAEQFKKEATEYKTKFETLNVAHKNGVKDVDYFNFELEKAKGKEDFSEETFINNLKTSKPYIFEQEQTHIKNGDNTPNREEPTFENKVKGISSFNELVKLQTTI